MVGIIDMHCHIIADVDDGAQTLEESKDMLDMAYAEGIRVIIATPHVRRGIFECSIDEIEKKYLVLKELAKHIGDGIDILLGYEYYAEIEMVEKLKEDSRYTLAKSAYVLIEFSADTEFSYMRAIVQELVFNGYQPILAHAERYECLYRRFYVNEIVTMGARIQLNANSIIGENGREVKKFCKRMMKEDLLSFVGTDGHDVDVRQPSIAKCADYIEKKKGHQYAQRILIDNPRKIIESS